MIKVENMACKECGAGAIYYPEAHHLDGNRQNNLPTNLVLACPNCHAHFVFRFNYEDICILKMRGLSSVKIGNLLGISRQRVWQIHKRQLVELSKSSADKIDDLVRRAMRQQESLIEQQKEQLRKHKKRLKMLRAESSDEELQRLEEKLEEDRLRIRETKRGIISEEKMREIIVSMINKESSETGGKRR